RMTTASQALAAIRTRLEGVGSGITIDMLWHGDEQSPLPDTPDYFAYIVFNNQGSGPGPVSFGAGAGNNTYRNQWHLEAYVFGPKGEGLSVVMGHAETIAARLRSFRDSSVSCFSADVIPVGDGSQLSPPG